MIIHVQTDRGIMVIRYWFDRSVEAALNIKSTDESRLAHQYQHLAHYLKPSNSLDMYKLFRGVLTSTRFHHKTKAKEPDKAKRETASKFYETHRTLINNRDKQVNAASTRSVYMGIYTMADGIANTLEYMLIDGLSVKLAQTAPHISNRRSGTCHQQ